MAERTDDVGTDERATPLLVRTSYDWGVIEPSVAVVETFAAAIDVDPTALFAEQDATLYDYVDLEALDALVRNGTSSVTSVEFSVDEYAVTVHERGSVAVRLDGVDPR